MVQFITDKKNQPQFENVELDVNMENGKWRDPVSRISTLRRFHFTQTTRVHQTVEGGLWCDFEAVAHRRDAQLLHVAFTPPVEASVRRDDLVWIVRDGRWPRSPTATSDMEWIRPGTAEDRQKIVACLIKRKCDPNKVDYHDHSALHYACVWGWVPTVDLLLEEGADPECSQYRRARGSPRPSHEAVVVLFSSLSAFPGEIATRSLDSLKDQGPPIAFSDGAESHGTRQNAEITPSITRRRPKRVMLCADFARAPH